VSLRTRGHISAQADEGEARGLLLSPPPQGGCTDSPLKRHGQHHDEHIGARIQGHRNGSEQ